MVKERVLRTLVEKRVGSNPTPCTSELTNVISEVTVPDIPVDKGYNPYKSDAIILRHDVHFNHNFWRHKHPF